MTSFAKCKLCGEKISYSPDRIDNYGIHLMEKHPELDFAHFPMMYEPSKNKGDCECICGCGCAAEKCLKSSKGKKKSRHFKTSVQSWKCAQGPMLCPRCGKTNSPLIKRQRSKLTTTSCMACMILGCWPLCFLPFIISGSDLFYVYCKECGYFVGLYDRRVSTNDQPPCRIPGTGGAQVCGCNP